MTPVPNHLPRAAALDVARQLFGRIFNLALGVGVTALLVRALGEAGFGRWTTALVIVQMVEYFASFGMEGVAVRSAASERDAAKRARWVDALVSLRMALSIPAFLVSVAVLAIIEEGAEMRAAGAILAAGILLGGPGMTRAHFQLRLRNDVPVAVMTLNSVLWGAAVLTLYLLHAGIVTFAIAFVAVAMVSTAVQVVLALRIAPLHLVSGRGLWPELIRVGVPVGLAGLLILAYARLDQVLVFELAGERDAGIYGALYRVLEQAHLVPLALMTTLMPLISASAGDPARMRRLVGVAMHLLTVVSLAGLAVSLTLSRPLVQALFGSDFAQGAGMLPVLAGAYVAICFGYVSGNLVLVFRLQKQFMVFAGIGLAVNLALNFALIPHYGYKAAAWATLITEVIVVVPTLAMGLRRVGPGAVPVGPISRAFVAAGILAAVMLVLDAVGYPPLIQLLVAPFLYSGLCLLLRAVDIGELRLIQSERGRAKAVAPGDAEALPDPVQPA
jgi:O-antigen/teichoic acid export membrane protein